MSKLFRAALCVCMTLAGCDRLPSPVLLSDTCAIDVPARGRAVERGAQMHIGGWAFDGISGLSPEDVYLQLIFEDQRSVKSLNAPRGAKRPDVVKAYAMPGAEDSGFNVVVDTSVLDQGRYTIYVLQKTKDRTLLCAKDFHFTLK